MTLTSFAPGVYTMEMDNSTNCYSTFSLSEADYNPQMYTSGEGYTSRSVGANVFTSAATVGIRGYSGYSGVSGYSGYGSRSKSLNLNDHFVVSNSSKAIYNNASALR